MSSQPADLATLLGRFLDPDRVQHSLNVAEAASALARTHAPRLEGQARLAGLLHDNAKAMPPSELLERATELRLSVSPVEQASPALLHGRVGAALLAERFAIDDAQVSEAIIDHVTGRAGMGPLSRLLYVADQAAADRHFSGVDDLRAVMHDDLPRAVLLVARHKIKVTLRQGLLLDPRTVELYNELTVSLSTETSDGK